MQEVTKEYLNRRQKNKLAESQYLNDFDACKRAVESVEECKLASTMVRDATFIFYKL